MAKSGAVLSFLGLAMFIYVIDTTIMTVSMSALVVDLNTNLNMIQTAITVYTLTMAAFMITGSKLGHIWGSRRAFQIGLIVYGIGTVTTAVSPNFFSLLIGWSILEGLGAALIVPAINTLIRANFEGAKRATAYGIIGGIAAAGAAVGPIVGGWITMTYSWRLAFWVEAIIVIIVLVGARYIADAKREGRVPKLDLLGVFLSAAGLGLFVFGILQTNTQGWTSPFVWMLLGSGAVILAIFTHRALRLEKAGKDTLVRLSIFKHSSMSAGIPVTLAQNFIQNGMLYLMPLYAQLVMGLNAFETGLTVLPLSLAIMLFSVTTAGLGHRIYPRTLIQAGLLLLIVGGVLLVIAFPGSTSGGDFALAMFVIGAAVGLIAAQLPNLMLGGVAPDETSEAAGLAGTAQNLGMSLGTAIAGSIVVVTLSSAFAAGVADSPVLSDDNRAAIERVLVRNSETIGTELSTLLADQPSEIQNEVGRIAKDAGDSAFQLSALIMGLVGLIGYLWTFKLPKKKLKGKLVDEAVRSTGSVIRNMQLEPSELE